jgi:CRP/FNR family transcriptional regulator
MRIAPEIKHRRKREYPPANSESHLQSIENNLAGPFLKERLLGDLPRPVLEGFKALTLTRVYRKGAILFVEGQEAYGVFILSKGRIKLSTTCANNKKSLVLRIAEPDEVIGLPGVVSEETFVLTAEALEMVEVKFIPRGPFLRFLREHGEAAFRVAKILNEIYHSTFRELRYMALSCSAREKLARFLLDAATSQVQGKDQFCATIPFTQEEIAERIGVARETVTRLFTTFKRDHLIELQGSSHVITDRAGLEELLRA